MKKGRRGFLKIAGISALGLGAKPVLDVFASSEEEATIEAPVQKGAEPRIMRGPNAMVAPQWAMVIDTRKIESHSDVEPMIES